MKKPYEFIVNIYIRRLIVYSVIFVLVLSFGCMLEAKSYKSSFSSRSLRRKFGLSGSGFEWVPKAQKRFEKAKERDYRILLKKMNNNN